MAIAFRTESHVTPGIGANADPLEPTGAASGDVLIALLVWDTSVAGSGALPTGWIGLYDSGVVGASTNQFRCLVGYIVRGGSAVATAFTNPSSYREANILAFTGVDNTTPIDSQSASGTTGTTGQAFINPPATTTVSSTTLAVSGGVNWAGSSSVWTASTGYTIRSNNAAGNDAIVQTKTLGASGSEDPANITGAATSSASFWNGFTITLAPAGAGGTSSAWQRGTGPRQLTGPYSRQRQFGVDPVAAGSASGTAALDLTASATAQAPATATGALTLNANGSGSASPSATASLSLTGSATWTEPGSAALTLTGSSTASGSPTATGALSLTATGTGSASPTGTGSLSLTAAGVASASPTATGALTLTATGTAKAAATGTAALTLNATGTAQAPVTGTGALSLNAAGNATAAGTHTGALTLAGTATAQAAATATGSLTLTAVGTPQAPATGTGALTLTATGTPRAAGTGTGALSLLGSLTARAQAAGTALLSLLGLGAATGGGIAPTVRGWSTTGTTSPSSSTTQADTTTTSKATVSIL